MLGKILLGIGAAIAILVAASSGRKRALVASLPVEGEKLRKRTSTATKRLEMLEPSTRAFAKSIIEWARGQGIPAYLGETYRSVADQQKIDPKRTAIKKGSFGWHSVGRAFHIDIRDRNGKFDRDAYYLVGAEVRRRGGVWMGDRVIHGPAGDFIDLAHFEYHPGYAKLSQYRDTPVARQELAAAEQRASSSKTA